MNKNTLKVMTSSKNEHWCTPNVILQPLRDHLGPILLDPCSNPGSIVGAQRSFCGPLAGDLDGLVESWQVNGLVYVNPPYGRKIVPWIKKCAAEAAITKSLALTRTGNPNTEIVLLGPARTDTKWFQRVVLPTADAVILWEGRLKFEGAKDPAVFPSFLAYWGHRPTKFKVAYVGKGWPL